MTNVGCRQAAQIYNGQKVENTDVKSSPEGVTEQTRNKSVSRKNCANTEILWHAYGFCNVDLEVYTAHGSWNNGAGMHAFSNFGLASDEKARDGGLGIATQP